MKICLGWVQEGGELNFSKFFILESNENILSQMKVFTNLNDQ